MSKSGIDLPTQDILLTLDKSEKVEPGFVKLTMRQEVHGQFARALASGYLKFCEEGKRFSQTDSVQSFIKLAELHQDLTEQASQFLYDEVSFVYEDQQIQPLLLNFAAYRLKQVSRRYYFASLQNQPQAILQDLKAVIQERQSEYDALLQHV